VTTFIRRLPPPPQETSDITDLRAAVTNLSQASSLAVSAVRDAFVAGVQPLQTVSSGSAATYINTFGQNPIQVVAVLNPVPSPVVIRNPQQSSTSVVVRDPVQVVSSASVIAQKPGIGSTVSAIVGSTSHLGISTSPGGAKVSPPKPEIDQIDVVSDRAVGVGDSYYARVVVSISVDDIDRVSQVRLMRADGGRLDVTVPAVSALQQIPFGNTKKISDPIAASAFRGGAVGIGNQLSLFVRDDTMSPVRSVVSSASLRPASLPINTNKIGTSQALLSVSNADPSVLQNVSFFLNQRAQTVPTPPEIPLKVGQQQGINVLGGGSVAGSSQIAVTVGNVDGFREVGRVPPRPNVRVGRFVEIIFEDPSVVYGKTYTYYATCMSDRGLDGPRSRLVKADIVRHIPPAAPRVMYGVVAGRPRFSILCSGTYVDHVEVFRRGGTTPELVRLLGSSEAMITQVSPREGDSGFVHVGDLLAGHDRSITFVDKGVRPGQGSDYRFYTVDAYGLKSQTPFSCSVLIPDHGKRIPLALPSITAEQGISARTVNIAVSSDDPRITSFIISRREIGVGEKGYHQPSQPDHIRLGTTDPKRSRSRAGAILQGTQKPWLGVLPAVSGVAKMVDTAIGYDRPYQYSVVGVDIRGNKTSPVTTRAMTVTTKPVADPPVAVSCSLQLDPFGVPKAVIINWTPGTSDFSPHELIADQDALSATAVRSVYQVERRQVGRPNWQAMPAVTSSYFVDPVSDAESPNYRPPYALVGRGYEYRVIAMQSGGYVSPHTDPVEVVVAPIADKPGIVWARSTSLAVRPAHIVVSWNYNATFVDGWEVERAVTNKVFGSKIVSMDSIEARSLAYSRVAEIKRESSRAAGLATPQLSLDKTIYVGNRYFVDGDVNPANSYFYRVRAVDIAGRKSDWTYAGIVLTDSPHDRKFYSTLSDREKVTLSRDSRPIAKWRSR